MAYCCIKCCKSNKEDNNEKHVTLFRFPTNSFLREKWIEAITTSGHEAKISKSSLLCSLHFSKDCFGIFRNRLKLHSVPTEFPRVLKKRKLDIESDIENAEPSSTSPMEIDTIAQYEDENCRTPKKQTFMEMDTSAHYEDADFESPKKYASMEVETVVQYEDENFESPKKQTSMEIETIAQCKDETYHPPTTKQIYYVLDIKSGEVTNMTPKMLVKTLNVLKKTCEKKDKLINRLRVQHFRQKRKIRTLEAILSALRERNLISPTLSDTV